MPKSTPLIPGRKYALLNVGQQFSLPAGGFIKWNGANGVYGHYLSIVDREGRPTFDIEVLERPAILLEKVTNSSWLLTTANASKYIVVIEQEQERAYIKLQAG